MKKNRLRVIVAISLMAVLVMSLFVTGYAKQQDLRVALITSAAGANDKGYNESAIKGLEQAKKLFGINYKVVESSDIPGSLTQLAENGYQVIFSLEYNFDALIKGVGGKKAIAAQYPHTTFVVFNDSPNSDENGKVINKNVVSVLFDVHESSFMAGVLSVLVNENSKILFNTQDYNFTAGDAGRKIGFIGGTKSNGITVFSYGFAEGINYEAKKLNVKYTYFSDYNAGFTDSAAGATKANTYYQNGANVVFGVAGAVGDGIDSKAKEVKKLSIEVDANKDGNQPGYILTSVLKNTRVPVLAIIKNLKNGTLNQVNGKVINYNLASGATGITDLSGIESKVTPQGKAKWTEIKSELSAVAKKIATGAIKVTNAQAGAVFHKANLKELSMPND